MRGRFWGLAVLMVVISACNRKPTAWDIGASVPLFETEVSLDQVDVKYLTSTPSDSSYVLTYDNLVYRYQINDLQTSDTGIDVSFNLRKLRLNDQTISNSITLAQINPIFRALDGQTTSIPAQDQSNLSPTDIDASAFFETATLDTGYLDITISNELPVDMALVVFELSNASDGSIVASDSFLNIPANVGSAQKTIDLRGKTVEKTLKGSIKRLVTLASPGAVLIDADKGLKVDLAVRQLRPSYAVAAFPTQDVIDEDVGITMYMGGAEIKTFKVATGRLKIHLESTIQEDMSMVLALPGATKDGNSFYQEVKLPAAQAGGVSVRDEIYNMGGYLLDFRGKNPTVTDTVNTYHQILKVTMDSSGRKVAVGLSDSIRITYTMEAMTPEYAIGYLGQSLERSGPEKAGFELFNGLSGNLGLEDVKVNLVMRNSIGADGRVKLYELKGENIFDERFVALNSWAINSDFYVSAPPFQRGAYTETIMSMDANNSNIKGFLENMPQFLHYDVESEVNPFGNVSGWKDFVFDDSRLDVFLRVEAPLSASLGSIILRDTQKVNFKSLGDMQRVKSGFFILDFDNGFPIQFGLDIVLLDANYQELQALEVGPEQFVAQAQADANGFPIASRQTQLRIGLSRENAWALSKAEHVLIRYKLDGSSGGVKRLYNQSKVKVKARAEFEYEAQLNP